jgi:cellulose biosynthesis protein BcsQ
VEIQIMRPPSISYNLWPSRLTDRPALNSPASGTSYGDIFEAGRTQGQVKNAIKAARKHNPEADILHAVVLTKVNRRAAVTQASRQQLAEFEIPVLGSDLPVRTAYQQAWFRSSSPLDVGDPSVAGDVEAIAKDIGEHLGIY